MGQIYKLFCFYPYFGTFIPKYSFLSLFIRPYNYFYAGYCGSATFAPETKTKAMNQTGITSAYALSELSGQDRELNTRDLSASRRRLLSDEDQIGRAHV